MKKVSYALAMALVALSANAQSKLDAGSRMALDYFKQVQTAQGTIAPIQLPIDINVKSRGDATASVLISLNQGADLSKIEALGFEITSEVGNIVVANGPVSAIEQLAKLDEVKSISFSRTLSPRLDKARADIGADVVQEGGDGLPQAYDGTGVVTGIFDQGLDPNHPNFQDADGNSRVKKLWYYSGSDGKSKEYSDVSSFTTDFRSATHGTHTLGCMAGSFNKKGGKVATFNNSGSVVVRATTTNPYYGIATGSDIAVSCGILQDANLIAGIKNIIDYAEAEGKPVVVNISAGSLYGPHDGSDSFGQAISELTKKATICFAAGNDGGNNISISKTFSGSDLSVKTFPYASTTHQGTVDIWASNSEDFTVTPVIYKKSTGGILYQYDFSSSTETSRYIASSIYTDASYIHDSAFDNAFSQSYIAMNSAHNTSTNNRRQIQVAYSISYNTTTNSNKDLVFGLIVTGKSGQHIDMICITDSSELTSLGQTGWTDGTPDFSIDNDTAAKGVISVGSYTTRASWPTLSRASYGYNAVPTIGDISSFSSYGTLIDGRQLPTITAPGEGIISSISSYYTDSQYSDDDRNTCSALYTQGGRDYYWECEQGTSMSCPVAAGTIALWLQADPTLTTDQIVELFEKTAVRDEFVTASSKKFGAIGKINALAGIKYILGNSSVKNITADSAEKMLITSAGQNQWQVYVPGASAVKAALYSTSGQLVANVSANSDTAVIDGNNLTKGIYILNANGKSQRVIVK
jgi:hypothetical protein